MRRFTAGIFLLALFVAAPAHAVMEDYPSVKLQGLDKSVGRTVTFEATVGSTIQYGPLFVKIHACRKAPPIEKPESAAFLQIWEVPPGEDKSEWVFSGWMFASSPALSAMDHAVYDIWVLDCVGREEPEIPATAEEAGEEEGAAPAMETPAAEEEFIPDSEAEDQSAPIDAEAEGGNEAAVPSPATDADDTSMPYPGATPETALNPETQAPPQNPETDPGFTVYDMIRQGGGRVPAPGGGGNPAFPR